jgi:hypothetical protein
MNRTPKYETDQRVARVARLLVSGGRTSEVVQFASLEWGVGKRQAERYVSHARDLIREDMSMERKDFIAEKLSLMNEIQKKALQSNQLGAAIGAARLAAELCQVL